MTMRQVFWSLTLMTYSELFLCFSSKFEGACLVLYTTQDSCDSQILVAALCFQYKDKDGRPPNSCIEL